MEKELEELYDHMCTSSKIDIISNQHFMTLE